MILTLQVVGPRAQDIEVSRKVFDAIGGTIGRLPDNDWVFPDPYISGRHALIRYVNGKYFIEDTSTNGVFLNSHDYRLPRAQAYPLRNGDRLFLDAYEIEVSIEQHSPPARRDALVDPQKGRAPAMEEEHTASMLAGGVEELEDFDAVKAANATEWFGGPPEVKPRSSTAPVSPSAAAVKPVTQPVALGADRKNAPTPKPAFTSDDPFEILLNAAGIEGLDPDAETAQVLGELLRASVGGVMDVLRTRERIKDELRMRGTSFKAANNNPLKFSANVDDAFHNLLVKRNPAYLPPAEAFDDALKDVRDHQTATMLAMRLAFESLLARFDPARLQEQFDRRAKKGALLGVAAKLRYWDLYREHFSEMVKDADSSFRELFADEFARAYEEQLARLKALDRG